MSNVLCTYFASSVNEDDEGKKTVLIKIENELENGSTRSLCEVTLDYDSIVLSGKTPVTDENMSFFIQGKAIEE